MNPELALKLRAKKLGILIRDARLSSGKTMRECGKAIGISGSTISAYEMGNSSPSLPELEMLAYYLKVPVSRFWTDALLSSDHDSDEQINPAGIVLLRNQQIGEILRQAREQLELTYEEITEQTGITYGRMKRFESGDSSIPVPELELLSNLLQRPLANFLEQESMIGKWLAAQDGIQEYLNLPTEIQTFVTNPTNLPYLELARRLSGLSATQLRSIAESLLEITI
ncbi:helix-turn-helix domain-containing protein [bacterium]|nr:helix-turn-helix domain-containing protein [bacterium]